MKYEGWVYYDFYDESVGCIEYTEGRLGYEKALSHIRELAHKKQHSLLAWRLDEIPDN